MPDEENGDWDRILEERLAREGGRRPTAPLPEGATRVRAERDSTPKQEQAGSPSALAGISSRAQFDGTAPFQSVSVLKQLSPEEEEEAAGYLRSIPKTRKLIVGVALVVTAVLFGGGAFVAGTLRPPPSESPRQDFRFEMAPAGLEGFSAPPSPKATKRRPEFVPGLDPLPGF